MQINTNNDNSDRTSQFSGSSLPSGLFIVIEGIDGSGKTLQQNRLARYLVMKFSNTVRVFSEPSYNKIGTLAREMLVLRQKDKERLERAERERSKNTKDADKTKAKVPTTIEVSTSASGNLQADAQETELFNRQIMLLMCADRAWNLENQIVPALKSNDIVINSRYILSTMAYQGITQQDLDTIFSINRGFPRPNITIYLDCDPDTALERINQRNGSVGEGTNAAGKTADAYENKAKLTAVRKRFLEYLETYPDVSGNWTRIDTVKNDKDAVFNEIIEYLKGFNLGI